MPITGLTDRSAAFPEIGQIRKGAKKTDANKPGPDLDHFRFVADTETMRVFVNQFGDKPQEIKFISPFNTTGEVFEAWKEEYTASSLKHRCDGKTCVTWQQPNGQYSTTPKPCPGNCKQTGRLKIVIPGLNRLGFITVHTTSIWDILTIHQNLMAIEMLCGSLRGVPLVLKRVKRAISTPSGSNGQRARREKWLLTIEAAPEWVEKQLAGMAQQALLSAGQSEPLQLASGAIESDDENDEAEALCSPEVAAAIEKLWPEFGARSKTTNQVIPINEYLVKHKSVSSPSLLTVQQASDLLGWLQKRALPIAVAPDAKVYGWTCGEELAVQIDSLTKDLIADGVTESMVAAELADFCGQDRSAKVEPSSLTGDQAQGWVDVLKSWIHSRENSADAA